MKLDKEKYISRDKLDLLERIPSISKEKNLYGKHLYKDLGNLSYMGNLALLQKPIIAIIGSRSPNQYAKHYTTMLSSKLALRGFSIISGGAIGIDTLAHRHVESSAIMVLPCGIDICYPKENKDLISKVAKSGLVLSEYELGFMPNRHHFLERNRIIIALSDIVIIPYADTNSGSISSARAAVALDKTLYVLPHRMNESLGTQELLATHKAEAIYDVESFINHLCEKFNMKTQEIESDEILEFARSNGLFDEALRRFGNKILQYELEGRIRRNGGYIEVV